MSDYFLNLNRTLSRLSCLRIVVTLFSSLAVCAAVNPDHRVNLCAVVISASRVLRYVRIEDGPRSWRRKILLAFETMYYFHLTVWDENCDLFNSVEHEIVLIQNRLVSKRGTVGLTTDEATRIRFTLPHPLTFEMNQWRLSIQRQRIHTVTYMKVRS